MADFRAQTPVPARWRIVFAAALILAFLCGGPLSSRKDIVPPRDSTDNAMAARLRLQTAAVAFSSGKLAPRVLILTDYPESYWKKDVAFPELRKFEDSLVVIDPASVPDFGLGGPWNAFSQFWNHFRRDYHPLKNPLWDRPDREAGSLKRTIGQSGANAHTFDVILLDCAYPGHLFSRKTLLWSSAFFDLMKDEAMNSGGVFAVVLPPDHSPEVSACILAFLRRSFGNAGAFCFGDRVILASGLDSEPVFELDKLSATAELAGYYDGEGIPDNAIGLVLDEAYSDSIPAGLLEAAHNIAIPQRAFTPFRAVFARARSMPKLRRFFPNGFPVRTVCAWILGILLAAYPFLRYFISWKPVHKQAFRAFEDMFYLTGVLALFMMFSLEQMPDWGAPLALFVIILVLLLYECNGNWGWKLTKRIAENPVGRFILYLLVALLFGWAFFWWRISDPVLSSLRLYSGVLFAAWSIRARMKEWIQPGPAIPLAFLLGVIVSLGMFAVSLCFPLGPVVFAAVVCAYRLILLD